MKNSNSWFIVLSRVPDNPRVWQHETDEQKRQVFYVLDHAKQVYDNAVANKGVQNVILNVQTSTTIIGNSD